MLLLAAIGDGRAYGYGLIRDLSTHSDGVIDLSEGTVYPALHRLWRAGYLSREQQLVDGRQRLTYELTGEGRDLLAQRRNDWDKVNTAITTVLVRTSTSTR